MGSTRYESRLLGIAQQASDRARALIQSRYEAVDPPARLYFHVWSHTEGVIERGRQIAIALGLSPHLKLLSHLGCAKHDIEQSWKPVEKGNGIIVRERETVKNELASAVEAARFMATPDYGFTAEEVTIVMDSIMVTVPSWSVQDKTAFQPGLTPETHPVSRVVALADLSACAMDPKRFAEEGFSLFAEDQLDIMEALYAADTAADLDEQRKKTYRDRLLTWLSAQPDFVLGRRAMLSRELDGLNMSQRQRVSQLFSGFSHSISIATAVLTEARALEFVPLMRKLLPTAFPGEASA